MSADPITAAMNLGSQLIDRFWPDATEAEKGKLQEFITVFTARAAIVQAEASSESWLTSNWRPLTMVTFVALIVARWFGWAAPGISPEEYLKLWDIVELGLGGYVVGRSAEKVLPSIAEIIKK